jgi:hypothetical protein
MNGAAVPVKSAAVTLGLGLTMIPSVTANAIDGFVVGVLLCGLCAVLLLASRRDWLSRSRQSPTGKSPNGVACPVTMPDLFIASPAASPFGVEADEKLGFQDSVFCGERAQYPDCLRNRSRHGVDQKTPISWRSLLAPTAPRHAAPSPVITVVATGIGVVTSKFAVRPLPVRN